VHAVEIVEVHFGHSMLEMQLILSNVASYLGGCFTDLGTPTCCL